MEVDTSDVDFELINKLNTMGTRDKEDLLAQFQSIVGIQMSPGGCTFYLEMGNWNIQAALCAYYDVMSSSNQTPTIELEDETTHVNVNSIPPNQTFTKRWRLKNTGSETWPNNLKLKFISGHNFGHGEVVVLPPIGSSEATDVSVIMTAPQNDGLYEAHWRVVTITGTYCGSILTVYVNVDSSSLSSLEHQMSKLGQVGGEMNTEHPQFPVSATPFPSPSIFNIFGNNQIENRLSNNEELPSTLTQYRNNGLINGLENSEHSEIEYDDS